MNILIVSSGNANAFSFEKHQAFIYDQMQALEKLSCLFDLFLIEGKGIKGYLRHMIKLRQKIRKNNYDLVHAHYGIAGMLTVLSSSKPVVVTFHGSDINNKWVNFASTFAAVLSNASIFVSGMLLKKIYIEPSYASIIPCGVDFNLFYPESQIQIREKLGLDLNKKTILFASSFDNPIKNSPLVQKAVSLLNNTVIELLEIKNKSRSEVRDLLNVADMLIMTSFSEGSPQVIKEAMACNLPIVSTNVGDVKELLADIEGTYICSYEPSDVAEKIKLALDFGKRTKGREKIKHLDNKIIAEKISNIYKSVLKDEK